MGSFYTRWFEKSVNPSDGEAGASVRYFVKSHGGDGPHGSVSHGYPFRIAEE